jgi:hypothetical protein
MAFIVDIRRGNLQLHLMQGALRDSRRPRRLRVAALFAEASRQAQCEIVSNDIFEAVTSASGSQSLYEQNWSRFTIS